MNFKYRIPAHYPRYENQMNDFIERYNEKDAIRGYIRPDSFVFRMMNNNWEKSLEEKPMAFLDEYNRFADEEEVMFSLGTIFLVMNCEKVETNGTYWWEIQTVRGKKEAEIEKDLSRLY
jgi:hypothetical protein